MIGEDFAAIAAQLEPGASAGGGEVEPHLISIAISLKRIADTLDGTNGVPLSTAIEQAIGTGMFQGFQNMRR